MIRLKYGKGTTNKRTNRSAKQSDVSIMAGIQEPLDYETDSSDV